MISLRHAGFATAKHIVAHAAVSIFKKKICIVAAVVLLRPLLLYIYYLPNILFCMYGLAVGQLHHLC